MRIWSSLWLFAMTSDIPRSAMREKIAAAVSVPVSRVSVKATTTDHLGFVGKEGGMAAYAVALLESTA